MSSTSTVRKFDNDEAGYTAWLQANEHGFVINTRRNLPADYMILHTAKCHTIDPLKRPKRIPEGAYTERRYIKICGTNYSELIREFGRESDTCKTCHRR